MDKQFYSRPALVKRYTKLEYAVQTIAETKIGLPDPARWDDKNDVEFLNLYKTSAQINSIYVCCFTQSAERHHHWKSFSAQDDTVCLEFDQNLLERSIITQDNIVFSKVDYLLIDELENDETLTPKDLPFKKRKGFIDENEWRVFLSSSSAQRPVKKLPFSPDSLRRIILSPASEKHARPTLKEALGASSQYNHVKVQQSRLTNSPSWISAGRKIAKRAAE